MNTSNFLSLITIVPIAVILSIVFFLIKFFGKAYSDQVPFADNRSWHEELFGISFFSYYILSPAILMLIIYSSGWKFWSFPPEDWLLLAIGFLAFISLTVASNKAKIFFEDDNFYEGDYISTLKKSLNTKNDVKADNGDQIVLYRFFIFPVITLLIMYGMSLLFRLEAYYFLFSAVIYLFFHLTSFALLLSLIKRNILRANINFVDNQKETIKNCRIIKINNDNVKIKTEDNRFFLLSKTIISDIEFIKKNNLEDNKN